MKKRLGVVFIGMVVGLTGCGIGATKSTMTTGVGDRINEQRVQEEIKEAIPDTILWINATYGIITTVNGGDLEVVGGIDSNNVFDVASLKKGLESSWDITTKEDADQMITWLMEEGGHNQSLLEEYAYYGFDEYTRDELVEAISEEPKEDQTYFLGLYDAVQDYGNQAIVAWDLSRALQLLSWYYVTDLYTYEEAMDKSLEVAKKLQATYTSWDDMMKSYFYGFQYWNEDDPEDSTSQSYTRRKIYETLKVQEGSPYALEWNTALVKEW